MNREELILNLSIMLFVAFLVGWLGHWLFQRLFGKHAGGASDAEVVTKELYKTAQAREEDAMSFARQQGELINELNQRSAELEAAMDGLSSARQEVAELRERLGA